MHIWWLQHCTILYLSTCGSVLCNSCSAGGLEQVDLRVDRLDGEGEYSVVGTSGMCCAASIVDAVESATEQTEITGNQSVNVSRSPAAPETVAAKLI